MSKRHGNSFFVDIMSSSQEVTGSCLYCTVHFPDKESVHFIVDCGLFQEEPYDNYNKELLFDPSNVDFALLTHNHIDHTGRFPFIVQNGFKGPIYTSFDTSILLPLALNDTASILRSRAKKTKLPPLFTDADVAKTLNLVKGVEYETIFHVADGISCAFFKNGHLAGAAIILVQIEHYGCDPINLLFTGDYNNKNTFFYVPSLPTWVTEMPINVICESTYGYMTSSEIKPCFANTILSFFQKNPSGTVVLPAFSLGRSQEILKILKSLQECYLLPPVPIYLDGKLTLNYTRLFTNGMLSSIDCEDFLPSNLNVVDKTQREALVNDHSGKIIVSSSGMGSYGPVQYYIQNYIKRSDALIFFLGYCAENTLGYKLYKARSNDSLLLSGLLVQKKAKVNFTNEFSAHAKQDELISFLKQFENLNLVCITHGQSQVKEDFSKIVSKNVSPNAVGILSRDFYFRIKSDGNVRTLSTRFI